MTLDLDRLEALANAVGGDQWTPTYATRTDLAAVWLPDGDLVCRCYGNIGHWPDPINVDDVAEFIAAANPATILALIAEVRALREDAERWRTEMELRNDPTVAIMFAGTNNRCCIYRGGVLIAPGSTYAEAIDTARRIGK